VQVIASHLADVPKGMRYLALLLLLLATHVSAATAQPNVLLIITDDQGYGDLSHHGNPLLKTPVLDSLAKESVQMDRFFVSPLCAPTRSSLLTGRYSLRTGVTGVATNMETMRSEEVTMAEVLKSNGYRTGIFGKWHNGDNAPNNPESQGFDEVWGYNRGHWNNYFDTEIKHNGQPEKAPGFIVDATTDQAVAFMDQVGAEPFFAWVAYTTPHSPFQCPDAYFDAYKAKGLNDELACIYGMCANLDANVGRLLQHLKDKQLTENTIVIFLTDNGPNGARYNGDMKGMKGSFDEGGSRVPFFLRWPARFKESRVVKEIAMHIDVLPTVVELCGLSQPKTLPLDGRSLVPLLDGKTEGWPQRTLFTRFNLAEGGKAKKAKGAAAVRTQQHRAVKAGQNWELYDMSADPGQKQDIATAQPAVLDGLVKQYEAWLADVTADATRPYDLPHLGGLENPVELTAANGKLTGGIDFGGKAPNNAWLVKWTSTEPTVTWTVDVQTAGTYHAELQYLCAEANAGSTMELSAGGYSLAATVGATPIVQVPSPDRAPRKSEVFEHKWHRLDFGKLELKPGRTDVVIKCSSLKAAEALWLKSLHLKKL
jgi:arylsulfatase A-like enzyme